MTTEPSPSASEVARIDPPDLERRFNAMRASLAPDAEDLCADLVAAVRIQRSMLLEGVPAHLTPSEHKMGSTIMRLAAEHDALRERAEAAEAERDTRRQLLAEVEARVTRLADFVDRSLADLGGCASDWKARALAAEAALAEAEQRGREAGRDQGLREAEALCRGEALSADPDHWLSRFWRWSHWNPKGDRRYDDEVTRFAHTTADAIAALRAPTEGGQHGGA